MGNKFLRNLTLLLALAMAAMPASGASKKSSSKKRKPSASAAAPAQSGPGALEEAAPDKRLGKKPAVPELAPGELPLVSDGAIVLDGYSGRSLYEKNADQPLYPASTTKIMTALLVIEAGSLDQEVEVTDEDSKVGESSLNIKPGDRFTRRQALYGLMLKSANDIAHMLGRDNAGSISAFAEKMTRRAQELGATNTHFQNPHGLHHVEHYTTPRDLALIARAAMQQPLFRQIVGTVSYPWTSPTIGSTQLSNHNRLLREFPGCTGVKTGFTNPAQHTLASAALWGTDEMICVVMHSTKQGKWDDSKMLITYGFEHRLDPPERAVTAASRE